MNWVSDKISEATGMTRSAEALGVSFQIQMDQKTRSNALEAIPSEQALAFGVLVRRHPNIAPLVDGFDNNAGEWMLGDVRKPGMLAVINAANGTEVQPDGYVGRNAQAAAVWRGLADDEEGAGALGILENVAIKGRLPTVGAPTSREQAFERLAQAHAGGTLEGEHKAVGAEWARVLSSTTLWNGSRVALMDSVGVLVQRPFSKDEPGPVYWVRGEEGDHRRNDALAAVVETARDLDRFLAPPCPGHGGVVVKSAG